MNDANEVLEFWFGNETTDAAISAEKGALWFRKSDEVDREIAERFGRLIEAAQRGELNEWTETARGLLALVVVCDQFPRNTRRGSGTAFALDARARALSLHAINTGKDLALRRVERLFVYLPFEHSEDIADQDRSVALFEKLAAEARADGGAPMDGYVKYAEQHREIIARFGRFPHRNGALGRESTAEELAFLTEPGSSF